MSDELPIGAVEGQPGVTVVDQSNFQDYVTQELNAGKPAETEEPEGGENESPEAIAAAEQAKLDEEKAKEELTPAPKEGDVDGNKVFFKGKWKDKSDFGYRLHLKGQEAEKAAQAKIDAAEAKAKAAADEAARAAKERDELKAKYEPPKTGELGPKPVVADYIKDGLIDAEKFAADLEAWAGEKAVRDAQTKEQEKEAVKTREAVLTRWKEGTEAVATEIPDYKATIDASEAKLSNEATEAVLKAKNGQKILYHFAKNPEEAAALGKMTIGDMLMEIGRLDGAVGGSSKAPVKEEKTKPAEISRAPAPITPLKGANPGSGLKVDSKGEWVGTYEEFKAAVNAGKIQ